MLRVPYPQGEEHLPVIVDPAMDGYAGLVPAMSVQRSVRRGRHGSSQRTFTRATGDDAPQTIPTSELGTLVDGLKMVAKAVGRNILLP
jgi:3-deoxy-D-arabino-heptulosonate 7-phosphate (DAHP) synthase